MASLFLEQATAYFSLDLWFRLLLLTFQINLTLKGQMSPCELSLPRDSSIGKE